MIRLFIIVGIVGVTLAAYLATFGQGPDYQMSQAKSLLKDFEAQGLFPAADAVVENEEAEEGIFDLPPQDKIELKKAMSTGGMNMPMGTDGKTTMAMDNDATEKMPMATDGKTPAKMDDAAAKKVPMAADGQMPANMSSDDAMKMEGGKAQDGLKITEDGAFDREIKLTMAEWKFSNMKIDVKSGEKIRFTVINGGKIPHEFMFMTMPAMQAVTYRARRADWNLLEHKASFEKSLVLPGGQFSFVAEIQENGVWMFMCMLPYHMQMGMMGQMATPGMAMDMQM